jgi:hypothetical protein
MTVRGSSLLGEGAAQSAVPYWRHCTSNYGSTAMRHVVVVLRADTADYLAQWN